jgi:DNA-binding MarR family transcriptional regulator
MPRNPPPDDVVIPALLRGARGSYAQSIRAELVAGGFDDLPRNGAFVLGGMANHDGPAVDMIRGLGVTKQAASQLIDTLVLRGYLVRDVNPDDRRRLTIELTERGRAAAVAIEAGTRAIDAQLSAMITSAQMSGLRVGLAALAEIKEKTEEDA